MVGEVKFLPEEGLGNCGFPMARWSAAAAARRGALGETALPFGKRFTRARPAELAEIFETL
jgi:hypothetical protein